MWPLSSYDQDKSLVCRPPRLNENSEHIRSTFRTWTRSAVRLLISAGLSIVTRRRNTMTTISLHSLSSLQLWLHLTQALLHLAGRILKVRH